MTLNLTLLTATYVLQVSDRRITKTSTGEIHPLANKNVVFLARDGLVTICYSGPAYIEHVPTDVWIACKLAGEDIGPYLRAEKVGVKMGSMPKRPWLNTGQSVELLRHELEAQNLVDRLDVMVAGWQEHKRGMRPICWGIDARGATATAESPLHRYWHYERSPDGRRRYCLFEIPGNPGAWLSQSELYRLVGLLMPAARSPEAAVRRLIWAVRYVADRTSAVGPDCMCILLPNPDEHPELFVRYEPVKEARAHVHLGRDAVEEVPAAFSPWLVGPHIHAPPRMIGGGGVQLMLDHIKVTELTPPMPRSTGLLSFSTTQPRPSDPSLEPP